jgi:uncharacterized membrane protein (DUF4010 family)
MPELVIVFKRFAIALALGLIIGVEREREKGGGTFAGIRTFPLIALVGCICAMMNDNFVDWIFVAGFLAVSALVFRSYMVISAAGSPGITTEVAALIVFLLGGMAWWDLGVYGAALAVVSVMLLALKKPLEQLAGRIGHEDIIAAIQFGLITLIILPVVPNQTYGPLNVINPYNIWLMVVLISALNLIGYVLSKTLGPNRGAEIAGIVGGLLSSTAVALSFSRKSKVVKDITGALAIGIIIASTIMIPRVLLISYSINTSVGRLMIAPLTVMLAVSLIGCFALRMLKKHDQSSADSATTIEAKNPLELGSAIKFGLLFGIILFISKFAQVEYGTSGVFISSALAGLTDVDAVTISLSKLAEGTISGNVAALGIIIAMLANTLVKCGLVLFLGSAALSRRTTLVFAAMLIAGAVAGYYFLK